MKSLRNASSLILAAPNVVKNVVGTDSLRVLSLKRSSTTSHFPDAYVFPGGNCDVADHAIEWLSVLPSKILNVPLNIICSSIPTNSAPHSVSEAISLRITAIRETFEECGILLCTRTSEDLSSSKVAHLELDDADLWRKKIRKDAHEFINLCREHHCFPNVCNLYFLSTWITPLHYKRRYSCKFFTAVLDRQVPGIADGEEIECAEWCSLDYLLENAYLPPPQIYELSMLKNFSSAEVLCDFARKVNSAKCQPFMPISVNTEDGMVMLLPGDEKYEGLYGSQSPIIVEAGCSAEEFRGEVMHRVELIKGKGTLMIRNCAPRNHNDILNTSISTSKL